MNKVVIEHVKVGDLPEAWRVKLPATLETRVTVRIEEETASGAQAEIQTHTEIEDPLFGMWRDREEMADVEAYVRKLRAPRF